jgi:hypothetical protein
MTSRRSRSLRSRLHVADTGDAVAVDLTGVLPPELELQLMRAQAVLLATIAVVAAGRLSPADGATFVGLEPDQWHIAVTVFSDMIVNQQRTDATGGAWAGDVLSLRPD